MQLVCTGFIELKLNNMPLFFCVLLQMMSNVDGHSWALCAVNEERPAKIFTPLNKELIPITDSPVVVQQHNIPQQKFVLLSAKVKTAVTTPFVARTLLNLDRV